MMAWESRHRSHQYYYRKRRIGSRVVSEYVGAGSAAMLLAELDQVVREGAQEKRREQLRVQEQDLEIDQTLNLTFDLAKAALLLAGCHTHKGEWRWRRVKRVEQ